ncbi:hypothetical protein EV192_1177 [Actinocrispum wychmicini]|uniref:Uncharacterized protein n=1 Tax=Actinocrispum wychmicini TaxID=1213861 RepID=A0A4R2IQU2_9PSEU|nr:hypothetical protein EV192_1177 [Actinocrispum wychmicini]
MIPIDVPFRETAAQPRTQAVPLSHLSLELGHVYMEDFEAGPERLGAQLRRVARWAELAGRVGLPDRARVSTCFLIDDYFTRFASPAEVVPMLLDVAERSGLRIDYLARESACAQADGVPLASLVAGRLTAVPPVGSNGSRPPTSETGWLSNGERSPVAGGEAMRRSSWQPPVEIDARNHSVFVDVELWHDKDNRRTWSCAYLAAVWQLLRLGLIRNGTEAVAQPRAWTGDFPGEWDDLPPITKLNPEAKPFSAYRTFSVLPARFLPVENAVRIILSQVSTAGDVLDQIMDRSARDNFELSPDLTQRVDYLFFNE